MADDDAADLPELSDEEILNNRATIAMTTYGISSLAASWSTASTGPALDIAALIRMVETRPPSDGRLFVGFPTVEADAMLVDRRNGRMFVGHTAWKRLVLTADRNGRAVWTSSEPATISGVRVEWWDQTNGDHQRVLRELIYLRITGAPAPAPWPALRPAPWAPWPWPDQSSASS